MTSHEIIDLATSLPWRADTADTNSSQGEGGGMGGGVGGGSGRGGVGYLAAEESYTSFAPLLEGN
jgi:hypothetical protein